MVEKWWDHVLFSTLTNSAIGVFLKDIINHKLYTVQQKRKMFQIESKQKTSLLKDFQLFQKNMQIKLKYLVHLTVSETLQKKDSVYGTANFVASWLKWLQMIWNDSKWLQMSVYVSNKSTDVIWFHLKSFGVI